MTKVKTHKIFNGKRYGYAGIASAETLDIKKKQIAKRGFYVRSTKRASGGYDLWSRGRQKAVKVNGKWRWSK